MGSDGTFLNDHTLYLANKEKEHRAYLRLKAMWTVAEFANDKNDLRLLLELVTDGEVYSLREIKRRISYYENEVLPRRFRTV